MKKFLDVLALAVFHTVIALIGVGILTTLVVGLVLVVGWWAPPIVAAVLLIGWAFNRVMKI